jgi:8-hydroxy-5-deazaflavin:NADPH oxidoreductase
MKVTIIGTGNMGRAIGEVAVRGGHDVQLVGRDPAVAEALAQEIGGNARGSGPDASIDGEIAVLALWYLTAREVVTSLGDRLRGKVVVDISNPVNVETFDDLLTPPDTSAAEELARLLPDGTTLVKAFNTTFAGTLEAGEVDGHPLDVLVAGDDAEAKRKVMELAEGGGLRAVDAGPLKRARELEALGFLHMKVQDSLGSSYGSAVTFVS